MVFCSGPKSLEMTDEDKPILHLSKLVEGRYVFKLTITDDKGLSDSDTVAVNIKKSKPFIVHFNFSLFLLLLPVVDFQNFIDPECQGI